MVEEKAWREAVARGGEASVGPECRIREGWEERPEWVEM